MTLVKFRTKSVPVFASGGVAAIGLGVFVGWIFSVEPLMTVFPGLVRMKPNSAAAFLFASLALYLRYVRKHRSLQAICAACVAFIGVITVVEIVSGIDLHIDQLLFRDPIRNAFPGRMAQITAAAFLLTGLMLYPYRFRASAKFTDTLALVVAFGSTLAVVGYLYGVPILYGSTLNTAMAIHTGAAFLLLSLGFLCIQKRQGFGGIFRAQTNGGLLVRRLVPPAVLVPIVVGAVFNRFNFGQLRLGLVFIVMCNILFIVRQSGGSLALLTNRRPTARRPSTRPKSTL